MSNESYFDGLAGPDPIADRGAGRGRADRDASSAAPGTTSVAVTKLIERPGSTLVVVTCTIASPASALYRFWRDLPNLPLVLEGVEEVRVLDAQRSVWRVREGRGAASEREVILSHDRPHKLIAWASDRDNLTGSGRIEFHEAGVHGTRVVLTGVLSPSRAGPVASASRTLHRLKRIMEPRPSAAPEPLVIGPARARGTSRPAVWLERVASCLADGFRPGS